MSALQKQISLAVLALAALAYIYGNFMTTSAFSQYQTQQNKFEAEIINRLNRIENKIDNKLIGSGVAAGPPSSQ
jgi:hypothetical protein